MAGALALRLALDWMSDWTPQNGRQEAWDQCRTIRDAMQASRFHNELLYRMRLHRAGVKLQKEEVLELQEHNDELFEELSDLAEHIRFVMEQLLTASHERRQKSGTGRPNMVQEDEPDYWLDVWRASEYLLERPAQC